MEHKLPPRLERRYSSRGAKRQHGKRRDNTRQRSTKRRQLSIHGERDKKFGTAQRYQHLDRGLRSTRGQTHNSPDRWRRQIVEKELKKRQDAEDASDLLGIVTKAKADADSDKESAEHCEMIHDRLRSLVRKFVLAFRTRTCIFLCRRNWCVRNTEGSERIHRPTISFRGTDASQLSALSLHQEHDGRCS